MASCPCFWSFIFYFPQLHNLTMYAYWTRRREEKRESRKRITEKLHRESCEATSSPILPCFYLGLTYTPNFYQIWWSCYLKPVRRKIETDGENLLFSSLGHLNNEYKRQRSEKAQLFILLSFHWYKIISKYISHPHSQVTLLLCMGVRGCVPQDIFCLPFCVVSLFLLLRPRNNIFYVRTRESRDDQPCTWHREMNCFILNPQWSHHHIITVTWMKGEMG